MLIIDCTLFPLEHLYRHLLRRWASHIRRLPRSHSFNELSQRRLQAKLRPLSSLLWTLIYYVDVGSTISKIILCLLILKWQILFSYHLIEWFLVMIISKFIHRLFLIHQILHRWPCSRVLTWRQRAHNVFFRDFFRWSCHWNAILVVLYHIVFVQNICYFFVLYAILHHLIARIHWYIYLLIIFM